MTPWLTADDIDVVDVPAKAACHDPPFGVVELDGDLVTEGGLVRLTGVAGTGEAVRATQPGPACPGEEWLDRASSETPLCGREHCPGGTA
ncbi:hypothetical protein ACFP2T_46750 [Plantactinospora solaniradicis]|uniref:Uncharacterized protein n=1 Tax=Plantactinospora solaniradicis TaxID=1723736 RepID=A0ABW1KQV4_9ACTN